MAGRIPPQFIDELLANSDVVEVIGRFVQLQKKGREYMACCPFHEEKTPSFSVNPQKQFYYCFGCGAGGTAVKFLMEYRKMDFVEAIETLAQFAGVEVPREAGGPAVSKHRKQILSVLAKTSEFYRTKLAATPAAGKYLARRGIDKNTAAAFGLGYAPPGFDNLKRLFAGVCDEQLLLRAGLLGKKDETGRTYDKFRDRLMFPIRDKQGHTVAFGGRVLKNEDQPKYLNSPETEVFHKRRTLYGAYEIREVRKLDEVIVVEGYMDVVSLFAHGVPNAVATLGTAVTGEHLQQLFRLCDKLVFCFDGDLAGRKAAALALRQALPLFHDGRTVRFMFLPEGEDPDSFIRARGKEAMQEAAEEAAPLSVFMFEHLSEALDLSLPEGRAAFAERARPLLAEIPRGTFRDLVAKELAGKAGVEIEHLSSSSPQVQKPRPPQTTGGRKNLYSAMRVAVALLLSDPSLAKLALPHDEVRKIKRPGAKLLADMLARIEQNPKMTSAALLEHYRGSDYEQILIGLLSGPLTSSSTTEFRQVMQHLHKVPEDQELQNLIEKSRTQALNEKEKSELQGYLSRRTEAR